MNFTLCYDTGFSILNFKNSIVKKKIKTNVFLLIRMEYPEDLDIILYRSFYTKNDSDKIFNELKDLKYDNKEESKVFVYGKWHYIPRKQVAFGERGLNYNFSGSNIMTKEWPIFLKKIRDDIQKMLIENKILPKDTKNIINYVLVNYYKNGEEYIGPHSDDEKDLLEVETYDGIKENIIISLSFGEARDFIFINKKNKERKYYMNLKNGDLLIMRKDTQKNWKHTLPKRLKIINPRINLTFRFMKN